VLGRRLGQRLDIQEQVVTLDQADVQGSVVHIPGIVDRLDTVGLAEHRDSLGLISKR